MISSALLLAATAFAFDFTALKPDGYVSDFSRVLDAGAKQELEKYCARVEAATGAQIALVTIPTLGGEPVEDVANAIFRKWGIGKKRKDEGILLLLVTRDRLSRLEVGYGLEPILPDGLAGSITHCNGYRGAAVARTDAVVSLGIDAEPHAPLPPRVLGAVTAPGDAEHLAELAAADPAVHWDRLLFSAKEAVYKAWYPLTQRWLGFSDASLTLQPLTGTFTAHILIDGTRAGGGAPLTELTGRYTVERALVVTAVAVDDRA